MMQEHLLKAPDVSLAWRERKGPGVPALFLSGGPGMPDYLREVALLLPARWVLSYDQRGTGGSEVLDGDYSCAAHVRDIERLRLELGTEKISIFGHSWGGLLAQLYAAAHPDRVESLYLCSASTGYGPDWMPMERAVFSWNRRHASRWEFSKMGVLSLLAMLPGNLGQWAIQEMYGLVWLNYQPASRRVAADPAILAGAGRRTTFATKASAGKLPAGCIEKVLAHVEFPILQTYGADDIYGELVAGPRDRLPNATFQVWPDVSHLPWLDAPERFETSLQEFFALPE